MTESNARKIFGRNLTDILYEKRISQKELGRYMGVSSATTSDWCSGKKMPRIDKLTSICNYLHVTMTDLVEEHEDVEKSRHYEYYTDPATADLAQHMATNPELRALFDVQRDMDPEDLKALYNMALALKRKTERLDSDDPA